MQFVCALLALLAAPFWETKAAREWSDEEVQLLLHDSPWAQTAGTEPLGSPVQVYLATARPVQEAEEELARRRGKQRNDEYVDYVRQEGARNVILAIAFPKWTLLADAAESQRMQEESIMKVGRKKYKMSGHFPPTPSDPFLRLVYPRVVAETDKSVIFELYLPGSGPYHEAEFRVRDLRYKGKLEM
jgi:hypothetical protein